MPVTKARSLEEVDSLIQAGLAIPVHRFVSLQLIGCEPGVARFQMEVGNNATTPANTLHGGVLSLVLEIAAYAASLLQLIPADKTPTTIDFHNQPMRTVLLARRCSSRAGC